MCVVPQWATTQWLASPLVRWPSWTHEVVTSDAQIQVSSVTPERMNKHIRCSADEASLHHQNCPINEWAVRLYDLMFTSLGLFVIKSAWTGKSDSKDRWVTRMLLCVCAWLTWNWQTHLMSAPFSRQTPPKRHVPASQTRRSLFFTDTSEKQSDHQSSARRRSVVLQPDKKENLTDNT